MSESIDATWEIRGGHYFLNKERFYAMIGRDNQSLEDGLFRVHSVVYEPVGLLESCKSRSVSGRIAGEEQARKWCEIQLEAYEKGEWPVQPKRPEWIARILSQP
jgi:hypothetical protein